MESCVLNLVTGGTGFLGSHLVESLVARGEEVRALVRLGSNTRLLDGQNVDLVFGTLADRDSLDAAAAGVDRVYHCAALAADWAPWAAFEAANVEGVRNLLDACLEAELDRFIHVSTTDVYGHPDHPANEMTPYRLRGFPYGDTKIKGEKLVWDYHRRYGLPVTVIRPAAIYGPRSTTFINEIVDLLRKGTMVHIGKGDNPAGLTYVSNVVDLMLLAADTDLGSGQAYNASDGSALSWRTYVNRLADIVDAARPRITIPHRAAYGLGWSMEKVYGLLDIQHRPLLTRMAVELFATVQSFPIDKAQKELGYQPRVDFAEGMEKIETWLRESGII
jgi:nucleoside-diphosphate-sugar epimerase